MKHKYTYVDPLTQGSKRFYLTRKEHNTFFPKMKIHWTQTYEYYVNDSSILLHRFSSLTGKIAETIISPVGVFMYGIFEYKAGFYRLWHEKKCGAFSSNIVWKVGAQSELYEKLFEKSKETVKYK